MRRTKGVASSKAHIRILLASSITPWVLLGLTVATIIGLSEIAVRSLNVSASGDSIWDPSILGVPWAKDFLPIAANQINVKSDVRLPVKAVGDGIADDTAAVTAAVRLASSSGGGTVYFPIGDYKIVTPSNRTRGNPLVVPPRVILRGSSSLTSRIFVNDANAASETDYIGTWGGIDFRGSSLTGMTDLGVFAVNSSSKPCAVIWNRGSDRVNELFFNNLDVHLANCRPFWFETVENLVVQNSLFDSSAPKNGPVYVVDDSGIQFLNNRITYHFGRVQLQENTNLVLQGNSLIRDAQNEDMDNGTSIESGGVELSIDQNVQVLNNTIQTLNAPADEHGDGEAITTQNSNIPDLLDAGNATRITATTLSDTNALWGPVTASRLSQYQEIVAIVAGSGTGQWRTIKAIDGKTKTLTVSPAWNPVPANGSSYSIFVWTLMNANIQGNTLIDNPNGIVIWDGCNNCTVQNNTLINSRGILFRSVDELPTPSLYPEGRRVHELTLNSKILDNVISNSSGLRPAYLALDAEAFAKDSYRGMGIMNVQIEGNTIKPYAADPSRIYDLKHNQISQEGFFPCILFGPALVKDPLTTVFQNIDVRNNSQNVRVSYVPPFSKYTTTGCVTASAASRN
jgi:parallel beta-helix repeat protein